MSLKNTENNGRQGAGRKPRIVLTIFVVFFISAWTFFLGVMVGRDMSPVKFDIEKLQRQIEELQKEALQREKELAANSASETPEPDPGLEFYDALKEEDRPDPLDSVYPEPEQSPEDLKKEEAPDNKTKEASPPTAPRPSGEESAEEKRAEEKNKDKPLKNYSIQVASSKDPKEADKLVEKFRKKGYPAYRASVELKKGGVWHRVRIGPFKAYSEAKRMLAVVKKEKSGALILEH